MIGSCHHASLARIFVRSRCVQREARPAAYPPAFGRGQSLLVAGATAHLPATPLLEGIHSTAHLPRSSLSPVTVPTSITSARLALIPSPLTGNTAKEPLPQVLELQNQQNRTYNPTPVYRHTEAAQNNALFITKKMFPNDCNNIVPILIVHCCSSCCKKVYSKSLRLFRSTLQERVSYRYD